MADPLSPNLALAAATAVGGALRSAPAGPSSADSIFGTNQAFDNSGWNVSFGSSKIDSQAEKSTSQNADSTATRGGDLTQYLPYAVLIIGAIVAIKIFQNGAKN